MSSLVVHHLNNSRSQRILWLLEELQVPYEIQKYQRLPSGLAPPELLAINPLGKAPAISDAGHVLSESGAIVEYIISKYGKDKIQVPEAGLIDNIYFTHYPEGSLQPVLVNRRVFNEFSKRSPALADSIKEMDQLLVASQLEKHGKLIEDHLAKTNGWFAGGSTPTSADYMMLFGLETFINRAPEYVGPKMREYVLRVQARPAYKKAIERGGEYAFVIDS
ncbi:thioredoxin-like protein [Mycena floridula]|nr:thioredoxin-like protein [Mycena floridula]